MIKKIFEKNKLKNCVYLDSDIYIYIYSMQVWYTSVNMSDTQQVIVKSYGQHTYLEEGWNLLNLNFMQTHHFRLKFYSPNIIFSCI